MTRDERLDRLEYRQAELAKAMTQILAQLSEQSLQLRFILRFFKFEQTGGPRPLIIGGHPAPPEVQTLGDLYRDGGRDQVLATLDAELAAVTEHLAEQLSAEGTTGPNTREQYDTSRPADHPHEGAASGEPHEGGDAPGEGSDAALGPAAEPERVSNFAKATAH